MSLKRLSKDTLIYGITTGIKSAIPILMLPILTAYLSPKEYGMLSIIEVSILFLMPFISLSSHGAVKVMFFKLRAQELKQYITDALYLSLFLFFIFLLIFVPFNNFLSELTKLPDYILLLLPLFALLRVVGGVAGVILQVKHKPLHFSGFSILQTLIDVSFSILFIVYLRFDYVGRLAGMYGSFFISTILGLYILLKMNLISLRPSYKFVNNIIRFGGPLIPHAIGGSVLAMSDRYFIAYFIDTENVAYYTTAYQLSALMLLFVSAINIAWTPYFFKLIKDGGDDAFKEIFNILQILVIVIMVLGGVIYMLDDLLFNLFCDVSYESAKNYFPYLLIGFVFQSIYIIFSSLFFYEKKTIELSKITISAAVLNLILNYFFILEFSAIGVAYATAVSWFLFSIVIVIVTLLRLESKKTNYA